MKLKNIILCIEATSHSIGGKEAYIAYLNTFKSIIRELMTIMTEDADKFKSIDTYNPGTLRARSFGKWWSDNNHQIVGAIRAIQEHRRLPIPPTVQEVIDTGRTIYKADAARRNDVDANSDRSISVVYKLPQVLNELGFHNLENTFTELLNFYQAEFKKSQDRWRARMRDRAKTNASGDSPLRSKGVKMDPDEPIPANARFINHDQQVSASTRVHQSSHALGIVEQTIRRLPARLQDEARKHVSKANNKLSALRDFLIRNGFDINNM